MALSTRIGHDPEDRSRKGDLTVHEREDLQTIHEVYAAFGKGDVSDVLTMLAEDAGTYSVRRDGEQGEARS